MTSLAPDQDSPMPTTVEPAAPPVRMHLLEDTANHLNVDLTLALRRHIGMMTSGGLTAHELTSAVLSATGGLAAAALIAITAFAKPESAGALHDEAVEKLMGLLRSSRTETLAKAASLAGAAFAPEDEPKPIARAAP